MGQQNGTRLVGGWRRIFRPDLASICSSQWCRSSRGAANGKHEEEMLPWHLALLGRRPHSSYSTVPLRYIQEMPSPRFGPPRAMGSFVELGVIQDSTSGPSTHVIIVWTWVGRSWHNLDGTANDVKESMETESSPPQTNFVQLGR